MEREVLFNKDKCGVMYFCLPDCLGSVSVMCDDYYCNNCKWDVNDDWTVNEIMKRLAKRQQRTIRWGRVSVNVNYTSLQRTIK